MTDIVEQARHAANGVPHQLSLLDELADEIKRLREQVEFDTKVCAAKDDEIEKLRAELAEEKDERQNIGELHAMLVEENERMRSDILMYLTRINELENALVEALK